MNPIYKNFSVFSEQFEASGLGLRDLVITVEQMLNYTNLQKDKIFAMYSEMEEYYAVAIFEDRRLSQRERQKVIDFIDNIRRMIASEDSPE